MTKVTYLIPSASLEGYLILITTSITTCSRSKHFLVWHTPENVSLPPVNLVNNDLSLESIVAKFRQEHRPDNPVYAASRDDSNAHDAVQPVRQRLVDAVAIGRRHEGRNSQVDVAEQEENGDRERGFDRRVPLPRCPVEVEMDQGTSDEDVDDGERVRDDAS